MLVNTSAPLAEVTRRSKLRRVVHLLGSVATVIIQDLAGLDVDPTTSPKCDFSCRVPLLLQPLGSVANVFETATRVGEDESSSTVQLQGGSLSGSTPADHHAAIGVPAAFSCTSDVPACAWSKGKHVRVHSGWTSLVRCCRAFTRAGNVIAFTRAGNVICRRADRRESRRVAMFPTPP